MKKQYIRQLQVLGDACSLALESRHTVLLSSFLFLTGLFAGVFLELTMIPKEKEGVLQYLQQYLTAGSGSTDYPSPFPASVSSGLFLLLIICLSGITVFGFPAALFAVAYKGMGLGFSAGLILENSQENGAALLLTALTPQSLFQIPAFLLAAAAALNYSFRQIQSAKQPNKKRHRTTPASYLILILFLALLIILGSGIEAILYAVALSP